MCIYNKDKKKKRHRPPKPRIAGSSPVGGRAFLNTAIFSTPILTVEAFSAIQTFTKQIQYYHKI